MTAFIYPPAAVLLGIEPERSPRESASPILDAIMAHGAEAGIAIADEIRRKIVRRLARVSYLDIIPEARRILAKYEPLYSRTLSDTMLAAWLASGNGVLEMAPHVELYPQAQEPVVVTPRVETVEAAPGPFTYPAAPPVPPRRPPQAPAAAAAGAPEPVVRFPIIDEAQRNLERRGVVTRAQFDALTTQQRETAFTVARIARVDTLERIQQALVDDIGRGGTLRQFRDTVDEILGTTGTLSPGHVENVYRTNVAQAYTSGLERVASHPAVETAFPYRETVPIHDSRLTELCRVISKSGIDGTGIFRADDPVWRHFKPPRHWQCRCGLRAVTLREAAGRGIEEAREWLRTGQPPASPLFVAWPDVSLPAGWKAAA